MAKQYLIIIMIKSFFLLIYSDFYTIMQLIITYGVVFVKRIFSVILCVSVFLSCNVLPSYANDTAETAPPDFIDYLERFSGALTSVIARSFNKIFHVDENDIDSAREAGASWEAFSDNGFVSDPEQTLFTQTWVAAELTFISNKTYADPFNDADVNLILVGNGRRYTVPGFWNGGSQWKIRFVCPLAGVWYFRTVCTDTTNADLHDRSGKIICSEYSGTLDIYKHGFVTAREGNKYFTYDDGSPFLYLGDTHWSLGDETAAMVDTICRQRASQGFSVIQSEPIGASFDLTDGVTEADIQGFNDYDEKFRIIADAGLVHANAEFFFPSDMAELINKNGGYSGQSSAITIGRNKKTYNELSDNVKQYIDKISRYWVARYSAYPVFWTLGQEIDNDFYWSDTNHAEWLYANNPYKTVAESIARYDAYDHPLSAHQENTGSTSAYGNGNNLSEKAKIYNKDAEPSAFYNVKEHNWYAAQWSPSKTKRSDFDVERDYWYNSQGKPVINYEGAYCYLWTKNFGSRMQGWCAYLNGMYGYGWGGHDTWSYTNVYNEEKDSTDGVDVITSQEKINATWEDSLEYESSYQSGYMREFFNNMAWYNLIPRFDNKAYFVPCCNVYNCTASNADNTEMVIYFYSFSDNTVAQKINSTQRGGFSTGTVGNLTPDSAYRYKWFNPITGEYSEEYTFTSSSLGTYYIGPKQWDGKSVSQDMVFYMYQ